MQSKMSYAFERLVCMQCNGHLATPRGHFVAKSSLFKHLDPLLPLNLLPPLSLLSSSPGSVAGSGSLLRSVVISYFRVKICLRKNFIGRTWGRWVLFASKLLFILRNPLVWIFYIAQIKVDFNGISTCFKFSFRLRYSLFHFYLNKPDSKVSGHFRVK